MAKKKKSFSLFLDDMRQPMTCYNYMPDSVRDVYSLKKWIIVRDYDGFVKVITEKGLPELISFDHDLADEHYHESMFTSSRAYSEAEKEFKEKTGKDCAQWLLDYCIDNQLELCEYIVHSMNPIGRKNIIALLERFKRKSKL